MRQQSDIKEIEIKYKQTFTELTSLPLEISELTPVMQKEAIGEFTKTLRDILKRHAYIVPTMATGILKSRANLSEQYFLKSFLDRFYMSRIGIRTHLEHFCSVSEEYYANDIYEVDDNVKHFGVLARQCNVAELIQDVAAVTSVKCRETYCDAPPVQINVINDDANIVYCPGHLYYILEEILKNSMRAVVEFHGQDAASYPPIIINLCKDAGGDFTIKVSDRGGGVPQNKTSLLFSYCFSTAEKPANFQMYCNESPFAGLGYGMALSRLHARYWGGELTFCPLYGYGSDTFVYIRGVENSAEVIPTGIKNVNYSHKKLIQPNVDNWMIVQRVKRELGEYLFK